MSEGIGPEVEQLYFRDEETERTEDSTPYVPKSPEGQLVRLSEIYPGLDTGYVQRLVREAGEPRTEEGEDLILVCPKISEVADLLGIKDPYGSDFAELLAKVFEILSAIHPISISQDVRGRGISEAIRSGKVILEEDSITALRRLEEETPGVYLVFPFQCGVLFKENPNSKETREAVRQSLTKQWPSTPWEVAHFLIMNPKFLMREGADKLDVASCPGLVYSEAPETRAFFEIDDYNNPDDKITFCMNTYPNAKEATGFIRGQK